MRSFSPRTGVLVADIVSVAYRMEWVVINWNEPAKEVYRKMGAEHVRPSFPPLLCSTPSSY